MEVEPRIARAIVGALRERDSSGHEIWRWLGPVHGAHSELTEANLYPTLHALESSGLLESHWREGESIRRAYRIAGGGLEAALANSWAPIARRRDTAAPSDDGSWGFDAADRERRAALPADRHPGAERDAATPAAPDTAAPGASEGAAADADRPVRESRAEDARPADEPAEDREAQAETQIAGYLDDLAAALPLDDLHRPDVLTEIGDHIRDAAAELRVLGNETDDAVACAIERLGSPVDLGAAIGKAQATGKRLESAVRWGSGDATLSALVTFSLTVCVLFFATPFLLFALHLLGGIVGIDVYAPTTSALDEAQVLLPADLAAFVAARRSISQVAVRARRSERTLGPVWAAIGFVPLAVIALVVPVTDDPVSLVATAALPFCWVAGCLRPVRRSDLVTRAGIAIALVALGVGLAFPGLHVWAYNHAALPPSAPTAVEPSGLRVVWAVQNAPTISSVPLWRATLAGPAEVTSQWSAPRIELWRLVRAGLTVVVDPTETAPVSTVDAGEALDFSAVSEARDEWFVLVTATGPGGARHTLYADIRLGLPQAHPASLLRRLFGR